MKKDLSTNAMAARVEKAVHEMKFIVPSATAAIAATTIPRTAMNHRCQRSGNDSTTITSNIA